MGGFTPKQTPSTLAQQTFDASKTLYPGKQTLTEQVSWTSKAQAAGAHMHAPAVAAQASASTSARVQPRTGGGNGPPDLGNYNSAAGKHVLVLRGWDDTAIAARRVELQGQLSLSTDVRAREKLNSEYEAVEWVAQERNLALPKDPGEEAAPQAYSGGKPIKFWLPDNSQGMRAMLEREMAAGPGYRDARDHASFRVSYSTQSRTPIDNDKWLIGTQQIALMDHDVGTFCEAFRAEVKRNALAMLSDSTVAIDTTLHSYGIAGGDFRLRAAHNVAEDPESVDVEVDRWVGLSHKLDSNRAAFATGHGRREDLSHEAERLRALQDGIAELVAEQLRLMKLLGMSCHPRRVESPRHPKPLDDKLLESLAPMGHPSRPNPFAVATKASPEPPEKQLASVQDALRARQAQFKIAWIEAERVHPVLAAYRGRAAPDASTLAGIGHDDATIRSVLRHVLPKLGNIYRTKVALQDSSGALDPMDLVPVVEITKRQMFVAEGSYRDRAVADMVQQAHDKRGNLVASALEAVMIGLALVTLVPTGGASIAAGLALTGLAYDIYMGLGEYEDFKLASAATDTDLDVLRSLSDAEPSLTPLLTRMVSAGLNLTVVAGLFKRAVALRRMASASSVDAESLAALNRAGEEAGIGRIGDDVVAGGDMNRFGKSTKNSSPFVEIRGYAQAPRMKWARNPEGMTRTVEEAIGIARKHGVEVADDVLLRKVSGKFLPDNTYAEYFRARVTNPTSVIRWDDFYNRDLDQLLVRVEQSVFESDEAIVAILGHEMHELNSLRSLFEESGGSMTYRSLHYLISPGIKGNLHDEAWDVADRLVEAMRKTRGASL